jgi:hypothetical protein
MELANTVTLPTSSRSIFSLRFLGLLGTVCAPGLLASVRRLVVIGEDRSTILTSLLGLIYLIGWIASTIGFRRMRATGDGRLARIVFPIQIVGLALAGCQQLMELSGSQALIGSRFFGICDIAWPLSHVFMLVVGGMVIGNVRIHGAARFAPLGCGLALPLSAALAPLNYAAFAFSFGAITTICFATIGITVFRSTSESPARRSTDLLPQ